MNFPFTYMSVIEWISTVSNSERRVPPIDDNSQLLQLERMSVYPRKTSPKRHYTESIKPAFIAPAKSFEAQELDAISKLKEVTHSLVRDLWEAGRDTDPIAQFAQPLDTPFLDPVQKLKELEGRVSFVSLSM